ncbi:MAG: HNH endonuclease [Thermodesulfobacteriota bacterium]
MLGRDWQRETESLSVSDQGAEARRLYLTASVRRRLHQRGFRERVLHAYREQCAFCRLRHLELLDAAHIIPDNEPGGEPVVNNGISLCKFHHAAFDRFLLAVRPDYVIEVRKDVLHEKDGPMLVHQIDTYGSATRKIPGKKSQSIRFSAEAVQHLRAIIGSEFQGGLSVDWH